MPEIISISLSLPLRLGSVNCYLIRNGNIHILIDTGGSNNRKKLEKNLKNTGCEPSNLKLIVLTHGDFDHTGNAAYLGKKFGVKIAMHYDDSGMVERGNIFWNRKKSNALVRIIAPVLSGFGKSERFKPDVYLKDKDDLSEYGIDARVLSIPGHSKGSIGILTTDGNLICGDLLTNGTKPSVNSIIDDLATANASIEKLKSLRIIAIYPGHGKPFTMAEFIKNSNT